MVDPLPVSVVAGSSESAALIGQSNSHDSADGTDKNNSHDTANNHVVMVTHHAGLSSYQDDTSSSDEGLYYHGWP